ncbi:DUF1641 domain-containing protein [Peribacillus psychrosaccharolyticus]|uniref:DUF1641 domain-containing protein n=1 Tax=Peribacillus psychrosaccharolyticus TaxID=1407 RepID=A0A974NKI9_PERPY|nr:DUF1641 domain-containing protein [Peribacillus psychrosaccharolyticus]MEC2054816.1 DUF1641 domain-containing protein [Peribacillus psychrosaccharolyticus]MED3743958.1 DUF1641 domain-containing protein [Peribacillus psychrosaccharolyticus]QQS99462.1 DUF1641 domain-containing protein [Peribacillus psychrosaccharolyticus]
MSESIAQTNEQAAALASTQEKLDILDQLLNPEVQESLTALVEQLPKLTELVTVMTKSYDFVQAISTDEVLKSDTVGAITEIAGPVVGSLKNVAATTLEAKERAENSTESIGLFGLMKMIKDPQAQKMFRFMNAFLQVNAENNKQK